MFTVLGLALLCSVPLIFSGSDDAPDPDPADSDTLRGTDGADTLTGDADTQLIDAGAGDDDITAEDATEIDAGLGDDTIEAGGGVTIDAGDGDDRILAEAESEIDAGAGDDYVDGGAASTLSGGDGDDTLLGSTWNSTVDGGAGDDVIDAGSGLNVLLTTGTGADTVTVNAGYPVTTDTREGNLTVTDYVAGQDLYQINGTFGADEDGNVVQGDLSFRQVDGGTLVVIGEGAAAVGVILLQGVDLADVDQTDFVPNRPPTTTLQGTDGADTLVGTADTDVINAGEGNDDITAENETTIDAGIGNDTIDAGGGVTITAGDGDDRIIAGGEAVIDAGASNDLVNGQGGGTVSGGDGNDTLLGVGFNSTIDGGAGDDVIGAGSNVLLTTGTGADTVSLNASYPVTGDIYNAGPLTVTDYVAGQDTYRISGTYAELEEGGYDVGQLTFTAVGNDVLVRLSGQQLMLLRGVDLADVDQDDFLRDLPPTPVM